MASQKDKDYHMLRNPEKYLELNGLGNAYLTKDGAEAYKRYKEIWSKYGNKSMVCDKRRRNSTRKSNQKNKQILHQIERAQFKSDFRAHLLDQDQPIETSAGMGNIYNVF